MMEPIQFELNRFIVEPGLLLLNRNQTGLLNWFSLEKTVCTPLFVGGQMTYNW